MKVSCSSYSTDQLFNPKIQGNNCLLKNDGNHLLDHMEYAKTHKS